MKIIDIYFNNSTVKKWRLPIKEFYVQTALPFYIKPFCGKYYQDNVFLMRWLWFFVSIIFVK
jgi:hypothetical protein